MATFEENIKAARDAGISDADIAKHFSGSKNLDEQNYLSKFQETEARSKMGPVEGAFTDVKKLVEENPMAAAVGATVLGTAGAVGANLVNTTAKERIKSNAAIRTAKAIAELPASPAVQLQEKQFAHKQEQDAINEIARSEKQARIEEARAAKIQQATTAVQQQAAAQQVPPEAKLTPEQAMQRSLSASPAGTPNLTAAPPPAGTSNPVSPPRPTTSVENAAIMLGKDAPTGVIPSTKSTLPTPTQGTGQFSPTNPYATTAPPAPAAPTAGGIPPAAAVALVNADPAALPEAGKPTDKPKFTRLRGDALIARDAEIARMANNPPEVAGQPGMREQYGPFDKKQINPATGKPFLGAGGYNWLHGQEGANTQAMWEEKYGQKNVSFSQVKKDYSDLKVGPKPEGSPVGGSNPQPKYIPNYIKGAVNPSVFAEGAQKIAASPFGQGVMGTVKGGAAMLPFALATDVKQQNVGYRREIEQEMKKTQNPERQIQLQSEIQKLDDDLYLKAMQRRFIDKNIPAALRK